MLAGLKLLELLSICNVDEFNLYQWVFIYDYFGVSIDMISPKKLGGSPAKGVAYPMKFQPFVSNVLPDGLQVDYLGEAFQKEVYQSDSSKKEKRRILITQNNVRPIDPARNRVRIAGKSTGVTDLHGVPESNPSVCRS